MKFFLKGFGPFLIVCVYVGVRTMHLFSLAIWGCLEWVLEWVYLGVSVVVSIYILGFLFPARCKNVHGILMVFFFESGDLFQ